MLILLMNEEGGQGQFRLPLKGEHFVEGELVQFCRYVNVKFNHYLDLFWTIWFDSWSGNKTGKFWVFTWPQQVLIDSLSPNHFVIFCWYDRSFNHSPIKTWVNINLKEFLTLNNTRYIGHTIGGGGFVISNSEACSLLCTFNLCAVVELSMVNSSANNTVLQ